MRGTFLERKAPAPPKELLQKEKRLSMKFDFHRGLFCYKKYVKSIDKRFKFCYNETAKQSEYCD